MEKILFEEVLAENRTYRKNTMFAAILISVCPACFLMLAAIAGNIIWKTAPKENVWIGALVVGFFLAFAAAGLYGAVSVLCSRRQYIRIYEDRILYRQWHQKEPCILYLRPDEYKIKLHHSAVILGTYPTKWVIQLTFLDVNQKKLFAYKAPSLILSRFSTRYKWEEALLSLGCEIIDPQRMLLK